MPRRLRCWAKFLIGQVKGTAGAANGGWTPFLRREEALKKRQGSTSCLEQIPIRGILSALYRLKAESDQRFGLKQQPKAKALEILESVVVFVSRTKKNLTKGRMCGSLEEPSVAKNSKIAGRLRASGKCLNGSNPKLALESDVRKWEVYLPKN